MLIYAFIAILGLIIGSFLNVVVYRLPKGERITGRSKCANCQTVLVWQDLIPILSYLILRRRCRYCKNKISVRYIAIESLTALAFVIFFIKNGPSASATSIVALFFIAAFLAVLFSDYFYFIIPDSIIFLALFISLINNFTFNRDTALNHISSALIFGLIFAIIFAVSRGHWLGFGDVKLVVLVGLVFGYPLGFLAVAAAVWIGAAWGLTLIISRRADLKTRLPLGSFISLSSIIFIIFSNELQFFRTFF